MKKHGNIALKKRTASTDDEFVQPVVFLTYTVLVEPKCRCTHYDIRCQIKKKPILQELFLTNIFKYHHLHLLIQFGVLLARASEIFKIFVIFLIF